MTRRGAAIVLVGCLSSAALAANAQDLPPLGGRDVQVLRKSSTEPLRYYPEKPLKAGVQGKAEALCSIGPRGDLENCVIQSESPPGYGFGEAAIQMAQHLVRIGPKAKDGSATTGRKFLFKMNYRIP